jgi:hypothetical protein
MHRSTASRTTQPKKTCYSVVIPLNEFFEFYLSERFLPCRKSDLIAFQSAKVLEDSLLRAPQFAL